MCTRRLLFAAALLAVLLTAAQDLDVDDDDESDSASFMIILEHPNGWQCAASLVSTRTGVTTARCARGRGEGAAPRELWALAAALLSARPPAPLAPSARRVTRVAFAGNGLDLADPALDIAVIELEAPFGKEAQAQPILMSTTRNGGESATMCYAIRALSAISPPSATTGGGTKRARFRVVNVALASATHCAGLVRHWSASHSRLLCFTGDDLCERDMGGGVVCDGKLCGVLSLMANDDGVAHCEKTYAAQNIARWRSFLHCAHTLGICGRRTCSEECTEHLLDETVDTKNLVSIDMALFSELSSPITLPRVSRTVESSVATDLPFEVAHEPVSQSIEFEPNRADFKAAPSRTSRPGLKAGEYGDNAAEYGADEAPPARSSPAGAGAPSRTPAGSPAPSAPSALSTTSTPPAPFAPALRLPAISESTASGSSHFNAVSMFQLFIYSIFFL